MQSKYDLIFCIEIKNMKLKCFQLVFVTIIVLLCGHGILLSGSIFIKGIILKVLNIENVKTQDLYKLCSTFLKNTDTEVNGDDKLII